MKAFTKLLVHAIIRLSMRRTDQWTQQPIYLKDMDFKHQQERRQIMKRIIKILSAIMMFFAVISPRISANDSSLYAVATQEEGFTEFAESYGTSYIAGYYGGNIDFNQIDIGRGITIDDPKDYDKVLFPVFRNNDIIGSLIVIDYKGQFTATYSELYADRLEQLQPLTSLETPLRIVVNNDDIFAVIDDKSYNLNNSSSIDAALPSHLSDGRALKVNDYLRYDEPVLTRIPTSYAKSWTVYDPQGTDYYCYSYALGNILLNMGYDYTPKDIQDFMEGAKEASKSDMNDFLESVGLSCTFKNRGYLAFESVMNIIYHNDSYIYIGAGNTADETSSHAFVIYGYSSNGSRNLYRVWNPWYDYTQSFDADTRIITTASSTTFEWDNGYLYNIE